jgi:hypothetical protein
MQEKRHFVRYMGIILVDELILLSTEMRYPDEKNPFPVAFRRATGVCAACVRRDSRRH